MLGRSAARHARQVKTTLGYFGQKTSCSTKKVTNETRNETRKNHSCMNKCKEKRTSKKKRKRTNTAGCICMSMFVGETDQRREQALFSSFHSGECIIPWRHDTKMVCPFIDLVSSDRCGLLCLRRRCENTSGKGFSF